MSKKFNNSEIKEYWTKQAKLYKQSPVASWSDVMVIEKEIKEISNLLTDGDVIADIGCANGYSTINFASKKKITIHGVDFIPEMITAAKKTLQSIRGKILGKIEFSVGDATSLSLPSNTYDKVISIRVIINLNNWESQLRGLKEYIRILKPGGTLILSEATIQGWKKLNSFRKEWGLTEIPMPGFNSYIDEELVVKELSKYAELVEIRNFASTYYVGTRILKPLMSKLADNKIDSSLPNMEWNRWFSQLPSWGDYGTQKLFIFIKK